MKFITKDGLDERQQQITGGVTSRTLVLTFATLLISGVVDVLGIYNIGQEIGFGSYVLTLGVLLFTYLSCDMILHDAYFGIKSENIKVFCLTIFSVGSIVAIIKFILLLLAGNMNMIQMTNFLFVICITCCMWYKKKTRRGDDVYE